MSNNWTALVPDEVAYRRAGGRRLYNSVRHLRAVLRRYQVAKLLRTGKTQAQIARRLGVHRTTISRDVAWLRRLADETRQCPVCGGRMAPQWQYELALAYAEETLED